jgi:hypothetical protein
LIVIPIQVGGFQPPCYHYYCWQHQMTRFPTLLLLVVIGAAFSSSKEREGLDLEWCMAPERGLPAPDVVIYLSITPEAAAKRGSFGEERYEKKGNSSSSC